MKHNSSVDLNIAINSGQFRKEEEFWLSKLSGNHIRTSFPFDKFKKNNNDSIETKSLKEIGIKIPNNISLNILRISKANDYSIFTLFMNAINFLVYQYTNEKDVSIVSPVYKQANNEKLVNSLVVIKNDINPKLSFKENLLNTKSEIENGYKNQNYPIDLLLDKLGYSVESDLFPLTDVAFCYDKIHYTKSLEDYKFNFIFQLYKNEQDFELKIKFNSEVYNVKTVERILNTLTTIFSQAFKDIDTLLCNYEILSKEDRIKIYEEFNIGADESDSNENVVHLFENQAKCNGEKIAIYDGSRKVTFLELNNSADTIAKNLINSGVQKGDIVGVLFNRSTEFIEAILGILKSGAAFLPISHNTPINRIKYILKESNTSLLITESKNKDLTDSLNLNYLFLDNKLDDELNIDIDKDYKEDQLCYVLYTSGSTGKPKGVMIDHLSLSNYINYAKNQYLSDTETNFPLFTSVSFDLTITSIFTPLTTGNSIIIFNKNFSEYELKDLFLNPKIGAIKLTPSHLKFLLKDRRILSSISETNEFGLKRLIVGGEKFDSILASQIHKLFKAKVEIYNEYGPTEATVGCMIHKYDQHENYFSGIFIGIPIQNSRIYLKNNELNPSIIGSIGEICISGNGLARGYLNNPELTEDSFIIKHKSNERIYKSGDLGKFVLRNNELLLDYIGRKDDQIKLNGHRIELSEIESTLKNYNVKGRVNYQQIEETTNSSLQILTKSEVCKKCLLPKEYESIEFDEEGVCNICNQFEKNKKPILDYFKNESELVELSQTIKRQRTGNFDCMLLFSGGKDSTYTLYKLKELGLKVLTFTFDNGYISQGAINNIKKITKDLNVENVIVKHDNMNQLFVESLITNKDVCSGCWNAINSIGMQYAIDNEIKYVFSGLSRGQIIEMRLEGLFDSGIFNEKDINQNLLTFRKAFHSKNNHFFKHLEMSFNENQIENIQFIDYFRYDPIEINLIRQYLEEKKWIQPKDTGFCSSNCLINDTGNLIFTIEKGYHFYSAQHSWDYRMGLISKQNAKKELDFKIDFELSKKILNDIGYFSQSDIKNSIVLINNENEQISLHAYIESSLDISFEKLKNHLQNYLPDYMIPSKYFIVKDFPLNINGKIDKDNLVKFATKELKPNVTYAPPSNSTEELLVSICCEKFSLEKIGIEDNFFDLGATSFDIIQTNNKLNIELDIDLPVLVWFENPNVRLLANHISSIMGNKSNANINSELESEVEAKNELLENSLNIFDKLSE